MAVTLTPIAVTVTPAASPSEATLEDGGVVLIDKVLFVEVTVVDGGSGSITTGPSFDVECRVGAGTQRMVAENIASPEVLDVKYTYQIPLPAGANKCQITATDATGTSISTTWAGECIGLKVE